MARSEQTAIERKEDNVNRTELTEAYLKEFQDAFLKDISDFCIRESD